METWLAYIALLRVFHLFSELSEGLPKPHLENMARREFSISHGKRFRPANEQRASTNVERLRQVLPGQRPGVRASS